MPRSVDIWMIIIFFLNFILKFLSYFPNVIEPLQCSHSLRKYSKKSGFNDNSCDYLLSHSIFVTWHSLFSYCTEPFESFDLKCPYSKFHMITFNIIWKMVVNNLHKKKNKFLGNRQVVFVLLMSKFKKKILWIFPTKKATNFEDNSKQEKKIIKCYTWWKHMRLQRRQAFNWTDIELSSRSSHRRRNFEKTATKWNVDFRVLSTVSMWWCVWWRLNETTRNDRTG